MINDGLTPAQRRKRLVTALEGLDATRHGEEFWDPQVDFRWNFGVVRDSCGSAGCALGYNDVLFGTDFSDEDWGEEADYFGLSTEDSDDIFFHPTTYDASFDDGASFEDVTPGMVAAKLRSAKEDVTT